MRPRHRDGWTLAEVLVVFAILGTLTGIVLPSYLGIMRVVRRTVCASNLRQVGMCLQAYTSDWHGMLPADSHCGQEDVERSPAWFIRLPAYLDDDKVTSRSIFQCGGYRASNPLIFANATPKSLKMNTYLDALGRPRHYRQGAVRGEAAIVLFVDAVAGETGMGQWGHCPASAVTDERHRGSVNILALDGRTQTAAKRPGDGHWNESLTWLPEGWPGGP